MPHGLLYLPPQSVSSFSSSAHEVNVKYDIANVMSPKFTIESLARGNGFMENMI